MVLQGQTIPIRIHMSTAHWGRFELRLCPLSDPSLVCVVVTCHPCCVEMSAMQEQRLV